MFVNVNDLTLSYQHEGRNGPHLVLINSLGCDLHIWDAVIPYFSERFQIIRYDKRGHGLSDCPGGPYVIADQTADLVGLLDQLGVNEAIVVGISVGGMIAQQFAAQHSDRVKLLILSDTGTRIGTADGWNQRIASLRQYGMANLADAILERWFAPSFRVQRPVDYRGYRNMLIRMPLEGYIATCVMIRDTDLLDRAKSITAPVLVLGGVEDLATPPDVVRSLSEQIPGARLELIEGAAHLPCIEQPAAMAEAVTHFFKEYGYV
jgi:3-oxoadipate enol-lactonase